jgi:hypothetical protein
MIPSRQNTMTGNAKKIKAAPNPPLRHQAALQLDTCPARCPNNGRGNRVEHLTFIDIVHGAVAELGVFVDLTMTHALKPARAVKTGAETSYAGEQV